MSLSEQSTTEVITPQSDVQQDAPMCITQHAVLQITLTGPALVFTIIAIMICIQIFKPSLTCGLVGLFSLIWVIRNDYDNFLSLGPGGTPSTFRGYLKITYLRMFALSDPYTPATFSGKIYPAVGYYQGSSSWIPERKGSRPKIAGIAPQRQTNQRGCPNMYQVLRKTLENVAEKHPESLRTGTSCFEKKGLALFAQNAVNATCRGEICHVHHSDQSLHMNLHPDDAKVVLEKGWGERHPLARGGWLSNYVPREFVMVYAPRDVAELDIVCRIVEAAGFWVSGESFELRTAKNLVLQEREE